MLFFTVVSGTAPRLRTFFWNLALLRSANLFEVVCKNSNHCDHELRTELVDRPTFKTYILTLLKIEEVCGNELSTPGSRIVRPPTNFRVHGSDDLIEKTHRITRTYSTEILPHTGDTQQLQIPHSDQILPFSVLRSARPLTFVDAKAAPFI